MPRLIDADELEKEIKRVYCTGCNDYHGIRCRACNTDDALDMIEDAPTIDAKPVRYGRWIKQSEYMPIFGCSVCGERNLFKNGDNVFSNYCPNCGATMDLEVQHDHSGSNPLA